MLLRKGRLGPARREAIRFISSMESDRRLLRHVLAINEAHVVMLAKQRIIARKQAARILRALIRLESGMRIDPRAEDIHVNVENEVLKRIGPVHAGNLHIAKSRNDQVSAAIRMELRENLLHLLEELIALQNRLLGFAGKHINTLTVGYTHTQPAQPLTFAHQLIAYADALSRDFLRLSETFGRVNLSPLGAGALGGTTFPVDRMLAARLLGFDGLCENTLDAVSSRDFVLECQAALAILASDLTRMVEDMIFLSSSEVGRVALPDEFTFTSSIMPQKKNPDVLEVIRARCAGVLGDLSASLACMKSLPSGYNLDLQEITPRLWSSLEAVRQSAQVLTHLIPRVKVKAASFDSPSLSYCMATELANMLVREHAVPFRTAHQIVAATVRKLSGRGLALPDLTPELLAERASSYVARKIRIDGSSLKRAIDARHAILSNRTRGGPSPAETKRMIQDRMRRLQRDRERVGARRKSLLEAKKLFRRSASELAQAG